MLNQLIFFGTYVGFFYEYLYTYRLPYWSNLEVVEIILPPPTPPPPTHDYHSPLQTE